MNAGLWFLTGMIAGWALLFFVAAVLSMNNPGNRHRITDEAIREAFKDEW